MDRWQTFPAILADFAYSYWATQKASAKPFPVFAHIETKSSRDCRRAATLAHPVFSTPAPAIKGTHNRLRMVKGAVGGAGFASVAVRRESSHNADAINVDACLAMVA
jgi:hypothetical protein